LQEAFTKPCGRNRGPHYSRQSGIPGQGDGEAGGGSRRTAGAREGIVLALKSKKAQERKSSSKTA
jgi:hypothetical protein